MKSKLKVGTVGNFFHHQCLCIEGIQWIWNEWINNWMCKWWLQHCRPPRVINRLKQGGLSESLPGLLSIPRVCIIVIGSLLGHPFRAEGLWIFFNQNSSILVSFQAQSKPEIRQLQVMSLGSLRSGTLRDGTVSLMLWFHYVYALYFHSLELLLPGAEQWLGKTRGKGKEDHSTLVFIKSWISHRIKVIHKHLYYLSLSSNTFLGGYFPHSNKNSKLLNTYYMAGLRSRVLFHQLFSKTPWRVLIYICLSDEETQV